MSQINIDFFEAYKSLEKICNEIYGQNNGVTQYISEMEGTNKFDSDRISGWNNDLKELKRVRHIRNSMAHEGSFDDTVCTAEDIFFVKQFYDRIMRTEDPLAAKRKLKANNKVVKIQPQVKPTVKPDFYKAESSSEKSEDTREEYYEPKASKVKTFLLIILVSALIIGLIILGLDLYK